MCTPVGCVCVSVCVVEHAHVEPEIDIRCPSLLLSTFWRQSLSLNQKLPGWQDWLARELPSSVCTSHLWDYRYVFPPQAFHVCVLGI